MSSWIPLQLAGLVNCWVISFIGASHSIYCHCSFGLLLPWNSFIVVGHSPYCVLNIPYTADVYPTIAVYWSGSRTVRYMYVYVVACLALCSELRTQHHILWNIWCLEFMPIFFCFIHDTEYLCLATNDRQYFMLSMIHNNFVWYFWLQCLLFYLLWITSHNRIVSYLYWRSGFICLLVAVMAKNLWPRPPYVLTHDLAGLQAVIHTHKICSNQIVYLNIFKLLWYKQKVSHAE